MTTTTKFFAVDPYGRLIGSAHDTYDGAAAACQDAALEDDADEETRREYTVEKSGENVIVIVSPNLGDVDDEAYDEECQRLQDCYSKIEAETRYTVYVRRARGGEAPGTYYLNPDGTLQILGYSLEEPKDLRDLSERTWEAYCR